MRKAPRGGVPAVLLAVATGVLGSLAFGEAAADAVPVTIELKAHDGCPTGNDFIDEMTARSKKVRAAKKGDKAKDTKVFKVTIKKVGKQSVGEIVIPTGPFTTKKETAKANDCDDVVEELAFIAAHSIDPDALVAPPTETASASVSTVASGSAPPPTASVTAAPTGPPSSGRLRISVGAGVQVEGLHAPGALLSAAFFAEASMGGTELIAPSARLTFVSTKSGQVVTDVGNGYFKWLFADLDLCPVQIGLMAKVSFRPCLGFEFGQLVGVGGQVQTLPGAKSAATSRTEPRLWFATRLLGRVAYFPIDNVFFELQAGLTLPLTRDEWVFEQGFSIYKAPALAPFAGLGLGVRF